MLNRKHLANAIRALSMDSVQYAKSGHPGMPMGMADIAESLWRYFLKHNPNNPNWINRDRFVLSNGHGSMLLYSILHLTGYTLSINDLKKFRKIHSKTNGHPEYKSIPGIETTTGPLGQGIGNAVGMAIAEKILSSQFNKKDHIIIDHYIYVFAGDGCLMEGVSHESCSLAGTLKLGKLIIFWDNNGISIDGKTKKWFSENVSKRFKAYGWEVIENVDGHNFSEIDYAIFKAKSNTNSPTLICCKTIIGFGSPNKSGNCESHGSPLGEKEILLTKKKINWNYDAFCIPKEIYEEWNEKIIGKTLEENWQKKWNIYKKKYPKLAEDLIKRIDELLPLNWGKMCLQWLKKIQKNPKYHHVSTRKSSQIVLNLIGKFLPALIGGSADLTESNKTYWNGSKIINNTEFNGNYIHYGVREFAMASIMNGLKLYKGFIPYGGTFLVFSDYARNAIRMAALMRLQIIYIFTHDSIGLGEDGPTHQPIEHLASLRIIPNLSVWRPCDTLETLVAWQSAITEKFHPTALVLSRQDLPIQTKDIKNFNNIYKGGYILYDNKKPLSLIFLATGSEVQIAVSAAKKLSMINISTRVVSMPSIDFFEKQKTSYKDYILPKNIPIITIEAGVTSPWKKYILYGGKNIGINSFGLSGSSEDLFNYFGFSVDKIVKDAKNVINK